MGATATLLHDGRVLVTGGTVPLLPGGGAEQFSSRAEVYDPKSGAWTNVAPMNRGRSDHAATLLHNGAVLVTGGSTLVSGPPLFETLAAAELYDPKTGNWTNIASMNHARLGHTATLLHDGRVLVAGGSGSLGLLVVQAELYDPATGTWTDTGIHAARLRPTATLLHNGSVLLVGETSFAEVWDPATGAWNFAGFLNGVRQAHTATLLHDGRVLVAGGTDPSGILSSAELYDPRSGNWTNTGSLGTSRIFHTATLLNDSTLLVCGGLTPAPPPQLIQIVSSSELYDPKTGTWTNADSLNNARFGHTATEIRSGIVLATGGIGGSPTAELYGRQR
jgi:N-acetylneuraminic acid mutarotase